MLNTKSMSRIIFCFLFVSLSSSAQYPKERFPIELSNLWENRTISLFEYYYQTKEQNPVIELVFGKRVPIEELCDSFYAKNKNNDIIPANFDVVNGLFDGILIESPLKKCKNKLLRKSHGTWLYYGPVFLKKAKIGNKQINLRKVKKYEKLEKWYNGDFCVLAWPKYYVGYMMSPHFHLKRYWKGRMVHSESYGHTTDIFASIINNHICGTWQDEIKDSDEQFSKELTSYLFNDMERISHNTTLSLLLYQKEDDTYDATLLLPLQPNNEVLNLFERIRDYVNQLPINSFRPFYTTDKRIITGRFYKINISKNGVKITNYLVLDENN